MSRNVQQENQGYFTFAHPKAWEQGLGYDVSYSEEGLTLEGHAGFSEKTRWDLSSLGLERGKYSMAAACCRLVFILHNPSGEIWELQTTTGELFKARYLMPHLRAPQLICYRDAVLYILDMQPTWSVISYNFRNRQIRRVHLREEAGRLNFLEPKAMAVDGKQRILLADQLHERVFRFSDDGALELGFGEDQCKDRELVDLAVDQEDTTFVLTANEAKEVVFRFDRNGEHHPLPNGRPFLDFSFDFAGFRPIGPVIDTNGDLLFCEGRPVMERGVTGGQVLSIDARDPAQHAVAALYRGSVANMLSDPDGNLLIASLEDGHLRLLQRSQKYDQGRWLTPVLDSRDTETTWHMMQLDAHIPDNTLIYVEPVVSNTRIDLESEEELNKHAPKPYVNCRNALFPGPNGGPRGRYARLRITLRGHGSDRPLIRGLRITWPRLSYLRYLPSIYSQGLEQNDFPERFLSLFETWFEHMERDISAMPGNYDPRVTKGDFLLWLTTWLGMEPDESLTDEQLRRRIINAPARFRERGTIPGIRKVINQNSISPPPERRIMLPGAVIVERYQLNAITNTKVVAELNRLYGKGNHAFCVILDPARMGSREDVTNLARDLEEEKPAHTSAKADLLQPHILLGGHSYLGVNTYMGAPQRLGVNTIIEDTSEVSRD